MGNVPVVKEQGICNFLIKTLEEINKMKKTTNLWSFIIVLAIILPLFVSSCGEKEELNSNIDEENNENLNDDKSNNEGDEQKTNRGPVSSFFEGNGTLYSPYLIHTAADLRKLSDDVAAGKTYREEFFKMTQDITINDKLPNTIEELNENEYEQWIPIGRGETPFCGTFDGNNHILRGIYINKPQNDTLGVFGYLAGTIKNLTIKDSYIKGHKHIGSIAGISTFENIGGISYKSVIEKCINYANIQTEQNEGSGYVGGIVGNSIKLSEINKCINYGTITSYTKVGGIIGSGGGGTWIKNSINNGTIKAVEKSAGIMGVCSGESSSYIIMNCINNGTIEGNDLLAGICSIFGCKTGGNLKSCVNYGNIITNTDKRGSIATKIIGAAAVNDNYYLNTGCPYAYSEKDPNSRISNNISMTAKEMQELQFLTTLNNIFSSEIYSKWVFGSNGYPTLEWVN